MLFSSRAVSERIIFPVSPTRATASRTRALSASPRTTAASVYYATYTAYNGRAILPQLIETADFLHFRVLTLNGAAVQNKGMALFPRRIDGRYAMLSRQDDENLFLMFSDNPHFWSDPQLLQAVESLGVRENRQLRLADRDRSRLAGHHSWRRPDAEVLHRRDPARFARSYKNYRPAQRATPKPEGNEREGYVPNVVYTCGSLIHNGQLILPYGVSDTCSSIVRIELNELLAGFI